MITFRLPREPGVTWTDDAAAALVGTIVPVNTREHEGGPIVAEFGTWTITRAVVVDEGAAVEVTARCGEQPPFAERGSGAMSLGFTCD